MSEDNDLQEQFADDVFDAVRSVAKEYGIASRDVVVQRYDPMVLGVRGTIEDDGREGRVELVMQLSGDLKRAREGSTASHQVNERVERAPEDVFRSFDIADVDRGEFGPEGDTLLPSGEGGEGGEDGTPEFREDVKRRVEFLKDLESLDDVDEI